MCFDVRGNSKIVRPGRMIVELADAARGIGTLRIHVFLFAFHELQKVAGDVILAFLPVPTVRQTAFPPQDGSGQPEKEFANMVQSEAPSEEVIPLVGNREADDAINNLLRSIFA
jgi:hypothetical protein